MKNNKIRNFCNQKKTDCLIHKEFQKKKQLLLLILVEAWEICWKKYKKSLIMQEKHIK
jgi:hypothetical protein